MRSFSFACALVLASLVGPAGVRAQAGESRDSVSTDSAAIRAKVEFLPVLGSAPETGLQYGVAVFATKDHPIVGTRPSSVISNAIRTAKGQTRAFVLLDQWTANNDWRVAAFAIWQQFPLSFFGIGAETEESAEEKYTPRGTDLGVAIQRRIGAQLWGLVSLQRSAAEMLRTETGGLLEPGTIVGSRGGRIVVAGTGLISDTRDGLFAPTRGHYAEITAAISDPSIGSEFSFTRVKADARSYARFGTRQHVVAVQATVEGVGGDAPFDQLSLIGSASSMRGYLPGRFRDNWMATAQAEVRTAPVGKWGFAFFSGGGVVAPEFGELAGARVLPSIGGGVRYRMDPASGATIRVDYARGTKGQSGLYVSFSEAF